MPEIIDVQPGINIFLRGTEYGLIKIKLMDGEGAVQENEFYCMSDNRDRIVEMLRMEMILTLYLQKAESENDAGRES